VAVPRNDNVCDVTRKETADKIKAIRNFLAVSRNVVPVILYLSVVCFQLV